MTGRRAIVGLCMLCALAFSAIAAQSASAATKGTTGFTCVDTGVGATTGTFSDPDCENKVEKGRYSHVEVPENTDTTIKLTPQTIQKFKSTQAGIGFTLETSDLEVAAGSKCTNMLSGKEHFFSCKGVVLTYSTVVVTPAALNCGVSGITGPGGAQMITTSPLTATTAGKGDAITLTPENENAVFTEFEFTGEKCALKGTKLKVVGSITLTTKGATLISEHAGMTTTKELRIGSAAGPAAGYEGVSTIEGGKEGESHKPLSMTTVETA